MKIGIIIHSKTGNTSLVAQKLKNKLTLKGNKVHLEMVTAVNDDQNNVSQIELKDVPKIKGYDMLILGAPVRGFSLSPVMKAFISQISTLKGIKMEIFVTQFFPFKILGGSHAIKQFREVSEAKGGKILSTGVVNWSNSKREKQINDLIENFSKLV